MRLSFVSTSAFLVAGVMFACCTGVLESPTGGEGGTDENAGASGASGHENEGGKAGSNAANQHSGGSSGRAGNTGAKSGGGGGGNKNAAGDDNGEAGDTSGSGSGAGGDDSSTIGDPPGRGGNTAKGVGGEPSVNAGGGKTGSGGNGSTAKGGNAGRGGNATGSSGGSSGAGGKGGDGSNPKGGNSGAGGNKGTGGTTVQQCTAPTSGSQGFTTRFWDCCKSSCGWSANTGGKNPVKSCNQQNQSTGADQQSACSNGGAFACWDLSPWAVSDTLAYGYAAFNGTQCGTCYQLQFTGQSNSVANDPGSAALCGKKMIVQIVNIGDIGQGQFDVMIPGGGVGQFDACSRQWGVSNTSLMGERYGGVFLSCEKKSEDWETRKSCTLDACKSLFSNSNLSKLLTACNWQIDWLMGADNPKVTYSQVSCPSELTSRSGIQ